MITKTTETRQILITPPLSERLKAGSMVLRAGEAVGEHITEDREEVLVILQGTARVMCGQDTLEAKAGELVFIPKNQTHNVINPAQEILRYVFIVTPV